MPIQVMAGSSGKYRGKYVSVGINSVDFSHGCWGQFRAAIVDKNVAGEKAGEERKKDDDSMHSTGNHESHWIISPASYVLQIVILW